MNRYTLSFKVKYVLFNSVIEQPKVALLEMSRNSTFIVEDG